MNELSMIVSILNVLGLGGFGFFLYYLIKGLKERITNLSNLAQEQKQTLDAVRERAIEVDKLSQYYKQALEDFQDMGNKLENRRQELIKELEEANKRKDEQLTKLKEIEIQEIELKAESLKRIPELEKELQNTVNQLRSQIEIITPKESINKLMTSLSKDNKGVTIKKSSIINSLTLKSVGDFIFDKELAGNYLNYHLYGPTIRIGDEWCLKIKENTNSAVNKTDEL